MCRSRRPPTPPVTATETAVPGSGQAEDESVDRVYWRSLVDRGVAYGLVDRLPAVLDDGAAQRLSVWEVTVQRRSSDARRVRDVDQRGGAVAAEYRGGRGQ